MLRGFFETFNFDRVGHHFPSPGSILIPLGIHFVHLDAEMTPQWDPWAQEGVFGVRLGAEVPILMRNGTRLIILRVTILVNFSTQRQ